MKKWMFLVMVIAVATIFTARYADERTPKSVKTATLQMQKIEQTVSCNGYVESGQTEAVLAPQTCIVDEVFVEVGQRVEKGERLLTINKEATRQLQLTSDRLSGALSLTAMDEAVCAPMNGVVVAVEAIDGCMLENNTPCVMIASDEGLQVRVLIREKLLPQLEIGQTAHISGVGFDKKTYWGELSEIASSVSENAGGEGVVEGVIALGEGEADASMRLGLTAKAKVVISSVEQGLLVPYEAIVQDENGEKFAYLVQGGKALRRTIQSQGEYAGGVLVEGADWEGARVVLEPDSIDEDGMAVSVQQEASR